MHRLFFAIYPDPPALQEIERVAANLRAARTIRGRWAAPEKYHITARFLGDFADAADEMVDRATAAAALVRAAAFEITLDRVATLRGRYQVPCVLRCAARSEPAIQALWQGLGAALSTTPEQEQTQRRFLPHLTIAYGDRMLDAPLGIAPIVSRIGEFVLVDSHQSSHVVRGRWPLHT
ncbi:MAG TPA: 2'-5' RNA ligase family protein [Rudaea sp.]